MSALRMLKECDFFRKLAPEHRKDPPPSGPVVILRAVAAAFILALTLAEFGAYLTPIKRQAFHLDMDGPMQLTRPRQIRVILDITIHEFPCIDLSLDYQDAMGNRQTDIRSGVLKQRLKQDGTPVGEVVNNDPKTAKIMGAASNPSIRNGTGNVTCGDCYGALPDGECCNTCSDVLYAYRMKRWALPRIESIKQCQQDGTSKSLYQPPQIARLQDYKADDYFNNFKTIGDLAPAGSEAGITAPLKLNLSLNLQNITFKPLNLKPLSSLHLDDGWDDWADDYEYDDYLYGPKRREKEANRTRSWPDCVRRNIVVNGYDIGEALMEDLTLHGAKDGCYKGNCSHTDKFNSDTMEHCAQVCAEVPRCSWWTWGIEEFAATCWLRTGKRYHTKRYGFSSGSRNCTAALKTATVSSTTTTTTTTTTTAEEEPAGQPRRLSSLDDLGSDYAYGSLMHMPMFEWHDKESERRKEQKGESCRIHGHFDVNRVPGNFHIGTHGASVPSYLSFYDEPSPPQQNMRHTIHKLAFADAAEGPLEADTKQPIDGFESPKAFTFQYYLMITPVSLQAGRDPASYGYRFKAASFVTNELIGPAVFFRMDMDPIRAVYYTETVRFSKFVVNICAVVGGCIAMSSMLLQIVDSLGGR